MSTEISVTTDNEIESTMNNKQTSTLTTTSTTRLGMLGRIIHCKLLIYGLILLGGDRLFIRRVLSIYHTAPAKWQLTQTGFKLDNIVTSSRDGSIYVSAQGRGSIFKYSNRQLTELYSIEDNISSSYENKVLEMINVGDSQEKLLSCWQGSRPMGNLTCGLLDVTARNESHASKFTDLAWTFGGKNLTFRSDPGEQIKVLADNSGNLLIVTQLEGLQLEQILSFADGPSKINAGVYNLPMMARFKLSTEPTGRIEIVAALPFYSSTPEPDIVRQGYIYAFDYEEYTIFVKNYAQKNPTGSIVSPGRFARICKNDTQLTSYTEILSGCADSEDLSAMAAHYDRSGRSEPTMHIIYERMQPTGDATWPTFCSFSMRTVQQVFNMAVARCNTGYPESRLLFRMHPKGADRACRNSSSEQDWCTSPVNAYIDGFSGVSFVARNSYMEFWGEDSNFILSAMMQTSRGGDAKENVYFVGEETGLLTKYGTRRKEPMYTLSLHDNRVVQYYYGISRGMPRYSKFINETAGMTKAIRRTKYAFARNQITAINMLGEIHEIPIDSCQYYATCFACLGNIDPLKCVWCGDTCRSSCAPGRQPIDLCPPYIQDFSPRAGPTTRGSGENYNLTKLIITGDGFGVANPSPRVLIGNRECLVDKRVSNNFLIRCQVPMVDMPTNATITVSQFDKFSLNVALGGSTTCNVPFEYKQVIVHGAMPPVRGAREDETTIYIAGENLDVGATRVVRFGEFDCELMETKPERITCKMSPLNNTLLDPITRNRREIDLPLQVLIDDNMQNITLANNASSSFVYYGDPPPPDKSTHEANAGVYLLIGLVSSTTIGVIIAIFFTWRACFSALMFALDNKDAKLAHDHKEEPIKQVDNSRHELNGLNMLNKAAMSNDYFGRNSANSGDLKVKDNLVFVIDDEIMTTLARDEILIERSRLTLGHVLGSGQFGRVYKGFLRLHENEEPLPVAVKTLYDRSHLHDDAGEHRAFLEEGLMMKDFEHENVLALLGVTFDSTSGLPMVITPFMKHGDLKSYISDETCELTVKELIEFGAQIARGMAYLSNLKFVHRDLAARNCMLDANKCVKVADFGLSRDIYERDYYASNNKDAKLPVKWMALESLEDATYTTKSDVWSYGICLWELITRGVVPYPDVDNFDIFSYLKSGRRMLRPRSCPVSLYKIMVACWSAEPAERPSFSELVELIMRVISPIQDINSGEARAGDEITKQIERNRPR